MVKFLPKINIYVKCTLINSDIFQRSKHTDDKIYKDSLK